MIISELLPLEKSEIHFSLSKGIEVKFLLGEEKAECMHVCIIYIMYATQSIQIFPVHSQYNIFLQTGKEFTACDILQYFL